MSNAARITRSKNRNKIALFGQIIVLNLLLSISSGLNFEAYSSPLKDSLKCQTTLNTDFPYISLPQAKPLFSESANRNVVLLSKLSSAQQETVALLLLGSLLLCLAAGLKQSRLLKLHSKLKATGFDLFSPVLGKAMYKRVIQIITNYRGQYGKY